MALFKRKLQVREDLVAFSLSEIILFFLFFVLILMGSYFQASGFNEGEENTEYDEVGEPPLGVDLGELLKELQGKDREIAGFRIIIGNLKDVNLGLVKERNALLIILAETDAAIAAKDAVIAALLPENVGLNLENEALEEKIATLIILIDGMKDLIGQLEAQLAAQQIKVKKLEREVGMAREGAEDATGRVEALEEKIATKDQENERLNGDIENLERALQIAQAKIAELPESNLPILVSLDESEGYTFETSSATIESKFDTTFRYGGEDTEMSGIDEVIALLKSRDGASIEAIEVIGHTDERVYPISASGLDQYLLGYVNQSSNANLSPKDNVGLGMARAAAAARYLKGVLLERENDLPSQFWDIPIIPLSAGQLQLTSGALSPGNEATQGDKPRRRRVEIRLRSKLQR